MDNKTENKGKYGWLKATGIVVLSVVAFAFAGGIGKLIGKMAVEEVGVGYNEGKKTAAISLGIKKAVEAIRDQAPIQIDEITTLRDAMAFENKILYMMELNYNILPEEIPEFKSELEISNRKNVCADQDTRKLIDVGGVMSWRYLTNNGETFTVTVSTCEN